MTGAGWTLFDTAIGRCGIGWSAVGVTSVQLPGAGDGRTAARLAACTGTGRADPPPPIRDAIDGIQRLLGGAGQDLGAVELDMSGVPAFNQSVYRLAREIGPGATTTYGELAGRLGDPLLAQDVGRALSQNPFPIVVPCHRVLAAGRKPGGFSAPGGVATKLRMLAIEGFRLDDQPSLFDLPPP